MSASDPWEPAVDAAQEHQDRDDMTNEDASTFDELDEEATHALLGVLQLDPYAVRIVDATSGLLVRELVLQRGEETGVSLPMDQAVRLLLGGGTGSA